MNLESFKKGFVEAFIVLSLLATHAVYAQVTAITRIGFANGQLTLGTRTDSAYKFPALRGNPAEILTLGSGGLISWTEDLTAGTVTVTDSIEVQKIADIDTLYSSTGVVYNKENLNADTLIARTIADIDTLYSNTGIIYDKENFSADTVIARTIADIDTLYSSTGVVYNKNNLSADTIIARTIADIDTLYSNTGVVYNKENFSADTIIARTIADMDTLYSSTTVTYVKDNLSADTLIARTIADIDTLYSSTTVTYVKDNLTVVDTLDITGFLKPGVTFSGDSITIDSLLVARDLHVGRSGGIGGNATFENHVQFNDNVTVADTLEVQKILDVDTLYSSTGIVYDKDNFSADTIIARTIADIDTLYSSTGITYVEDNMTVEDNLTVTDTLDIEDFLKPGITFSGDSITIDSLLHVRDLHAGITGGVGGNATFENHVQFNDNATIADTLEVQKILDADTLYSSTGGTFLESSLELDKAPGDSTANGIIILLDCSSTAIPFGQPVYVNSSGDIDKANATGSATMIAVGLSAEAVVANNSGDVIIMGTLQAAGWSWTKGALLYVSTAAGGLTETPPNAGSNVSQAVARAISATQILVAPNLVEVIK